MEAAQTTKTSKHKQYLLVIKNLAFLYSHFFPMATAVQGAGWEVSVAADCNADPQKLLDAGMKYMPLHTVGGLRHPFSEARSIFELNSALREVKPDIVHFIYLKNVLTGGILARINQVPAVLGAITGLGTLFTEDKLRYRSIRPTVILGLKYGFRNKNSVLTFENSDDQKYFVDAGAIVRERSIVIPGAGVRLDAFIPEPWRGKSPIILCTARMLRNKGIVELLEASRLLRQRGHCFELWLAGDVDKGNPTSLTEEDLRAMEREGVGQWLGHRTDIPLLLRKASIICLPTYREGLPKVLVEACAAGRPIVATDVPGCREVVRHGTNGLLVPPRDSSALADALEQLLLSRQVCEQMGLAARRIFEERFTLDAVLDALNQCYRHLGVPLDVTYRKPTTTLQENAERALMS